VKCQINPNMVGEGETTKRKIKKKKKKYGKSYNVSTSMKMK